jgi:hypothetical protein
MSSSEDEDVTGALAWLNVMNVQHQRRRRFWVHPYWRENSHERGAYKIFKELNLYPERFHSFYRISKSSFDVLVTKVAPVIRKKYTNFRQAISPDERLLITVW